MAQESKLKRLKAENENDYNEQQIFNLIYKGIEDNANLASINNNLTIENEILHDNINKLKFNIEIMLKTYDRKINTLISKNYKLDIENKELVKTSKKYFNLNILFICFFILISIIFLNKL